MARGHRARCYDVRFVFKVLSESPEKRCGGDETDDREVCVTFEVAPVLYETQLKFNTKSLINNDGAHVIIHLNNTTYCSV